MSLIHKKCNAIIKSSGKGDWGICTKCNRRVDHLMYKKDVGVYISEEVRMIND